MAKPKERPFKRKEFKEDTLKKNPLSSLCSEEQIKLLTNAATRGGAFICSGHAHAPYGDFYKGLRMLMHTPTFNGLTVFDSNIVFKQNWMRPIYVLTLNDAGNKNILHSIRELQSGKLRQRYLFHPEEASEQ